MPAPAAALRDDAGPGRSNVSALYRSEMQFRRLLEKLPAGAYTCDAEGLITYFNPHAVQLWGRTPRLNDPADRFCGSFKLFAADGTPIDHSRCWMALALETGEEYIGQEILVQRPDGRRLAVLAHASPVREASGKLLGAVNVLVDISDRKRAEEELREADRGKNEFIAILAHELRNPLAPIRNAVEILNLKRSPSHEQQWALDVIDRQVRQMTRLIDDLLDLARITSNKLELRRQRIELAEVLHAAVETSRPLIEASGQELLVTFPPQPIHLDGDLTRLAQIVSNLLNNAAKYTARDGRIWLQAECQGAEVAVKVRDTGIGIPADMLPRIFDMFTQADGALDRSRGGLGIGLTLAKRLVDLHGGSITAASDGPGQGSEFVVRLPVAMAPARGRQGAGRDSGSPDAGLALRILVVDDNEDAAASLALLLQILGGEVRTAHDGLEAVAAAAEIQPDVVLLDIGLPKMDGYDAARAMRRQAWAEKALLIAVTGWGQAADRDRCFAAGFDHHLVKPLDTAVLMQLLRERAVKLQAAHATPTLPVTEPAAVPPLQAGETLQHPGERDTAPGLVS
jgi:PAS domain S-box-containing protein